MEFKNEFPFFTKFLSKFLGELLKTVSNSFYLSTSRTKVLLNSPLNFVLGSYISIENDIDISIYRMIKKSLDGGSH
jgi:hypothetical protein